MYMPTLFFYKKKNHINQKQITKFIVYNKSYKNLIPKLIFFFFFFFFFYTKFFFFYFVFLYSRVLNVSVNSIHYNYLSAWEETVHLTWCNIIQKYKLFPARCQVFLSTFTSFIIIFKTLTRGRRWCIIIVFWISVYPILPCG